MLVEVLKSGASMRINDHDRQYCNFSRTLVRDLDFDSYMSIGCPDNTTASEFTVRRSDGKAREGGRGLTTLQAQAFQFEGLLFAAYLCIKIKNTIPYDISRPLST